LFRPREQSVLKGGPDFGELPSGLGLRVEDSRVAASEPALSHPAKPEGDHSLPSAETVALENGTRRAEFMNELDAIDQGIQQLLSSPYPEAVVIQSSPDPWTSELNAAKSAVRHFEESWPVQADDRSSRQPPKGANL